MKKNKIAKMAEAKEATPATPAAEAKPKKSAKKAAVTEETVEVLSALYGIEGNRVTMATVKVGRKLTNKMAGSDPAPKTVKNAIIRAKVNGKELEKTFNEGEVISF